MANAVIKLHDTGDGQFQAFVEYESETGFSEDSLAHQYAHLLMLQLGRWADVKGPETQFGNAPSTRLPVAQEQKH